MRKYKRFFPLYFAIIFTALTLSNRVAAEATLGQFPLCEASTALLVACPGEDGECLLVGDNEREKELYLFPVENGKLKTDSQRTF